MLWRHALRFVFVTCCFLTHAAVEYLHYNYCRKNIWVSFTAGNTPVCGTLHTAANVINTSCVLAVGDLLYLGLSFVLKHLHQGGITVVGLPHLRQEPQRLEHQGACLST